MPPTEASVQTINRAAFAIIKGVNSVSMYLDQETQVAAAAAVLIANAAVGCERTKVPTTTVC